MALGSAANPFSVLASEGTADSALAAGTAAAPGAGAAVASLAGLVVGGVYKVRASLTLTGTAETQLANGRIRQNGVTIGAVPTLSGAGQHVVELPRVTVGANGTVDVTAIATATAGAIYTASIAATRVA